MGVSPDRLSDWMRGIPLIPNWRVHTLVNVDGLLHGLSLSGMLKLRNFGRSIHSCPASEWHYGVF